MYSIINQLPKVEHHIHLLGSVRPETLLWVADNSGLDNRWDSVEAVQEFFQYKDFMHQFHIHERGADYTMRTVYDVMGWHHCGAHGQSVLLGNQGQPRDNIGLPVASCPGRHSTRVPASKKAIA